MFADYKPDMFVFVDNSIVLSNLSLPITMILLKNICFLLLGLLKKSLLWNWSEILTQIYFVYRWRPFWNTVSNIFVWNKLNKSIFLFILFATTQRKFAKSVDFLKNSAVILALTNSNLKQQHEAAYQQLMKTQHPKKELQQKQAKQCVSAKNLAK